MNLYAFDAGYEKADYHFNHWTGEAEPIEAIFYSALIVAPTRGAARSWFCSEFNLDFTSKMTMRTIARNLDPEAQPGLYNINDRTPLSAGWEYAEVIELLEDYCGFYMMENVLPPGTVNSTPKWVLRIYDSCQYEREVA